jgi:hypothetical protein
VLVLLEVAGWLVKLVWRQDRRERPSTIGFPQIATAAEVLEPVASLGKESFANASNAVTSAWMSDSASFIRMSAAASRWPHAGQKG